MDVTDKDLAESVREGFRDLELLKRYSQVLMGPCQGKQCLMLMLAYYAKLLGLNVEEIKAPPTLRPPIIPVPLGALAAIKKDTD